MPLSGFLLSLMLVRAHYLMLVRAHYKINTYTASVSLEVSCVSVVWQLVCSGAPGSGMCLFELWIRDPGWVKNQDLDPGA
jgi:hypothetical protein